MAAAALTAMTSFQVVLLSKTAIALGCEVVVAFFYGNDFFHLLQSYHKLACLP